MNDAADSGTTLCMISDWSLGEKLYVPAGKKVTIDMAGYRINANKSSVFVVLEKGELVLTSSKEKKVFSYRGYNSDDGKEGDYTVTAGGLITDKCGSANTIRGKANSIITLDGVAIAGSNTGGYAYPSDDDDGGDGAVSLAKYATLNMKNGASIEHCLASNGAGVCAGGNWVTVNMDASSISNNRASYGKGGGVRTCTGTTIKMTNGSHIDNNCADAGGGIYFAYSNFTLTGDGSGTVSGNKAMGSRSTAGTQGQSGGGIHVPTNGDANGKGLIENVTIANNYSAYDGGGIELDYADTTVKNCTITGNWCKYEGGAIYVNNSGETIEDCTITGNSCNVDSGGNYEGGGVFVSYHYDLKLSGTCIVKGNTRGKDSGNADDVFLSTLSGGAGKAYITGSLSEGSTVGVRTGITGDRRIAKGFKHDSDDCLFIDQSGYYVSYGSEEGGDAWQRHRELAFAAKLDGDIKARYKQGATATLVAPKFKGSQVFWRWDDWRTSGLNPIGDYLSGDALASNVFTFSMPQNDVNARTQYIPFAEKVEVEIDSPVAGKALPATAKVRRDDDLWYGNAWATASVTWYEVDGDTRTQVSGTAKAGTVYAATICCASDPSIPLYFNSSICWSSVKIPGVAGSPVPDSASVDPATGALTINAKFAKTDGEKTEVKSATATVKLKKRAALGDGGAAGAMLLAADGDAAAGGSAFDEAKVSYSYNEVSDKVSFAAPYVEGYNFCNWEGVDRWEHNDVAGTVTVPVEDLERAGNALTAVYTPAITKAAIDLDAPVAGETLATTVDDIKVTCSDGSTLSFAEVFESNGFKVTWAPEGEEDGTAGFSTAYTAVIELADGDDLEDVEDVLAQGAAVTCNGTEATAAGFTVRDGKLCLAVSFPATRDVKAVSVSQPVDVELTFEQAKACSGVGTWPLASSVDVRLENDEAAEGDITWQAVEGFDASATAAQELTVKGTVSNIVNADGDEIDDSGVSLEVTCTIKVAAPAQSEDSGDDNGSNATDSSKSALPKTGDSTFGFASFAVAAMALATAATVGGIAALRRGEN